MKHQFDRLVLAAALLTATAPLQGEGTPPAPIRVSPDGRWFQHHDGRPFFWLGDTAWLLFQKLDRAETERYLDDRRRKGFNIIQVMVLHTAESRNQAGAAALADGDPARPVRSAEGADYWSHIDWVLDRAAARGLYLAMVPAWGSIVKAGRLNEKNVEEYARFLGERYGRWPNVVWLNGGDIQGDLKPDVWRALGRTLRSHTSGQLTTFHPFGRTQSSTWFHTEPWLDFNMFQSGHRRYGQDSTPGAKEEDNWRYVEEDLALKPAKPTLDGEPSYEHIPQGLHDPAEPRWTDRDARRYAYWAVLAGAAGHTYGHSSVMQMHKRTDVRASYGATKTWDEALNDPGAGQMRHLKALVLSRPYFERRNDQSLIAGSNGQRYDRVIAARGRDYAFIYTHTGRPFEVVMGRIRGRQTRAWWFDPRTGLATGAGRIPNRGVRRFQPPVAGQDWVLVLDNSAAGFGPPA